MQREVKLMGRGGTHIADFINHYPEHIKEKVDLLLIITDTFLGNAELDDCKVPPKETDVLWVQTAVNEWKPRFGRVFQLYNER